MAAQHQPSNSNWGWLGWILVAIITFAIIKSCSSQSPRAELPATGSELNLTSSAEIPETALVPLPAVDAAAVTRAAKHLKLALGTEGFSGAMIYSQNCFESLNHRFSWTKLDQCEAFDTLTQLAISQSDEAGVESTYFDKSTLQARYRKVVTDQHGDPAAADKHLADLNDAALARISDLQSGEVETATTDDSTTSTDGGTAVDTTDSEGDDVDEVLSSNESE